MVRIVLRTFGMAGSQGVDGGVQRIARPESGRLNCVPGQRRFTNAFADLFSINTGRQNDVRVDTPVLRALAGNTVVLANGQRLAGRIPCHLPAASIDPADRGFALFPCRKSSGR